MLATGRPVASRWSTLGASSPGASALRLFNQPPLTHPGERSCGSEFAKVKDDIAPWRSEVVVGSQQAGLEALGTALRRFLDGRRTGRRVGFPRYRRKGGRESVIFQRPRLLDSRRVGFDRRLGPIRSRERFTKLQRRGSKWHVSFTVVRSLKERRPLRPNTVVGVDVGLRHLATLSTGEQVRNLRPLQASLRKLRRLQRRVDRQRRANNPENYNADGTLKPGRREWRKSPRMLRAEAQVRRLHERVANLRREQAHLLTTMLVASSG
jgi:putative transposase